VDRPGLRNRQRVEVRGWSKPVLHVSVSYPGRGSLSGAATGHLEASG
jgi:hypothetical protein